MKKLQLIVLLAGLAMLGALSIDTYLPSFPSMAREFGVGLDVIQQTLTVYLAATAVMTLFHGTLSDAIGRRPVILWSLAIYVLASIGAALAPSITVLILCRLLQGLCAGAGMVVGRAMIRDLFEGAEAQRVMSYTTVVFGLAPVVAPILGGWLEVGFGWRSVFVFLAGFVLLLLLACLGRLPESLAPAERAPLHLGTTVRNYLTVGRDPRFLTQCLSIALSNAPIFIYVSSAPVFILNFLHLPETAFAWLFIPIITGIITGSFFSARVARSWPMKRTIRVGFGILLAAALGNLLYCLAGPIVLPWAILPIMASTFGVAFIGPAMTLIVLDLHPRNRGLTSSFQAAFVMGGFAIFAGVVAPLLFASPAYLAAGVLACAVLSATLWAIARSSITPDPG